MSVGICIAPMKFAVLLSTTCAISSKYAQHRAAHLQLSRKSAFSNQTTMLTYRAQGERRISRRSSLTDDRVDEVINNLTNMHSMVKLLRESSVDKPDASRTWDVSRFILLTPAQIYTRLGTCDYRCPLHRVLRMCHIQLLCSHDPLHLLVMRSSGQCTSFI